MESLSHTRLLEILDYSLETGEFKWKVSLSNRVKVGDLANNISPTTGQVRIRIDGKLYSGNRLAWFYVTKEWPSLLIDHEDRNPSNNKWKNLRLATNAQNSSNYLGRNGKTKGVYFCKQTKKYRASIMAEGITHRLGRFKTEEEAITAYKVASVLYHKEFSPYYKELENDRTGV